MPQVTTPLVNQQIPSSITMHILGHQQWRQTYSCASYASILPYIIHRGQIRLMKSLSVEESNKAFGQVALRDSSRDDIADCNHNVTGEIEKRDPDSERTAAQCRPLEYQF
ncbi:hypothetical protein ONS96_003475 [Cadophora gregata f. sp. sojae]|nr:hypothetical protein ONS96_003475 [Cadophora gregata f. sp. sojae]